MKASHSRNSSWFSIDGGASTPARAKVTQLTAMLHYPPDSAGALLPPAIALRFVTFMLGLAILLSACSSPEAPEIPDTKSASPAPRSTWTTYHGDSALTGIAQTVIPETPVKLWQFIADAPVEAAVVSEGERIYYATVKGTVGALDLAGKSLWKRSLPEITEDDPPEPGCFDVPLIYADGFLIATTADGSVYSLKAVDGSERWKTTVDDTVMGTPARLVTADGKDRLYLIGQGEGILYCLDFATGALLWKTEGVDRCDASPAALGNRIVFGSCAAALHVYDATTGAHQRDLTLGSEAQVAGGVALLDGEVFSGCRSGEVVRARFEDGQTLWNNDTLDSEIFTTPAVAKDRLVVTTEYDEVIALDRATGKTLWLVEIKGTPSSPVIAEDTVIVVFDGTLYGLRLEDGSTIWQHEVSDELSDPAVFNGMIVVASTDGGITAFGAAQ